MAGNLHNLGMSLIESLREHVANHTVVVQKSLTERTCPIPASSPPIGQFLEVPTGIDLSTQFRVFYIRREYFDSIGMPGIGWVVVDRSDNSRWKVIPDSENYAWQYHGQNKTSLKLLTKGESNAA